MEEVENIRKNLAEESRQQVDYYLRAADAARDGSWDLAEELVETANLDKGTQENLLLAIKTRDSHMVEKVFSRYDLMLGQAICESCNTQSRRSS